MVVKDKMRRRSIASSLCLLMIVGGVLSFAACPAFAKKTIKKGSAKSGMSVTPDFAFPQTVEKNAGIRLQDALKSRNYEAVLEASIQMNVASGLISSESYMEALSRYDSLSHVLPAPWSNLALILEARLYSDIYSSKPWIFNNRRLPSTPRPENVMEWSKPMFAEVVSDLCIRSLQSETDLAAIPISSISGLLDKPGKAQKKGFSVFDFISQQAVGLLGRFDSGDDSPVLPLRVAGVRNMPLPESDAEAQKITATSVIDAAIANSDSDQNLFKEAYWTGLKLERIPWNEKKNFVLKCLERFGESPYCSQFIGVYCDLLPRDNESRREQLRLLEGYIEKYPEAEGINELKNRASDLRLQNVNVEFDSQMLPNQENRVVVSGENLYDFYVLAIALPHKGDIDSYRYSDLAGARVAASVKVYAQGTVPDTFKDTISLPPLSPGRYAIVPSRSQTADGVMISERRSYLSVVNVSGISAFSVIAENNRNYFYVISGIDGKPVENANVTLYTFKNGTKVKSGTYITDSAGRFEYQNGNYDYVVTSGNNRLNGSVYAEYRGDRKDRKEYKGSLFTDLSLYRPGAKVGVMGVIYSQAGKRLDVAAEKEVSVVLRDANWTPLDTIRMKSDNFGRFNGEIQLPETGLAGTWGLNLITDNAQVGSTNIQVAEYKTPSFLTEMSSASESYCAGDKLVFKGYARTYTGMPVSGAKVSYVVNWLPGWWRMNGDNATFGGQTVTDSDGSFEIILETSSLKGTPYERGVFQISGNVTDDAGETQPLSSIRFSLGAAFSISAKLPSSIQKEEVSENFKVSVNDIAGRPIKKTVYYQISNSAGAVVEEGDFESPQFSPKLNKLPSGRYAFKFSLTPDMKSGEENQVRTDSVILWSVADVRPPVSTSLWVPKKKIIARNGSKSIDVAVGSSLKDGYVLAVISDSQKIIRFDWYKISESMISVPVDSPMENERMYIEFIGESNLDLQRVKVEVIPYSQTEMLEIKTETFRDRIEPGAQEKWTFSINLSGKLQPCLPVIAVMSDKALNAIAPFSWNFNPFGSLSWSSPIGVQKHYRYGGSNNYIAPSKYLKNSSYFTLPGFNTYGYSLYSGSRYYNGGMKMMATASGVRIRGNAIIAEEGADDLSSDEGNVLYDSAENETVAAEAPVMLKESAVTNEMKLEDGAEQEPEIEFRDSDCPLAFFQPCLVTNEEGLVSVEFTAPRFVGTWQLQLLSYTPDLRGATLKIDAVASKSVMANLNAPRFVRTGDKVCVSATLYNSTDDVLPVGGMIEILNAVGDKIIATGAFAPVDVEPSGSRVVKMEFEVPKDVEALTIQAIAESASHSDGEQTIVPVLPATTVVRESGTFYMGPSDSETIVKLPEYSSDAAVTLSYCGNPTWECLTALPSLTVPDSESILAHADALFGNAVASGLLRKYPILMDGLRSMAAPENAVDSALISSLQKNAELKEILLSNTPWVNVASSETLRMQSLMEYADENKADAAINNAMKLLTDRQNSDGGWSWCPDMKSSAYMTSRVLAVLADLGNLGFLPEAAEKLALKAFGYMDRTLAEQWMKSGRQWYSLRELVHYLYAKSAFKASGNSGSFSALEKVAMKDVEKEWRDLSLFDKATAAMLLERKGKLQLSRLILESLRQYASESPEKGMWFDNISDVWTSEGALLTTARVLEAFSMIEPESPVVDKLRQWIVLSKQTQDWDASRNATEAISALLSSGSDWAVPSSIPVIALGDKKIDLPRAASLTGAFTLSLDAERVSGSILKIVKNNETPAWGGVVARFVSPIKETKQLSMPELKVSKALNVIKVGAEGIDVTSGNLKVGDKVRVTITITCDRDLDYVAVVDNRAACLEPADQLSAYTSSDGVWYYREVQDSKTTLFIPYLSKGTHVLSYDCYVDRTGEYSLGIVSAQSQYAPLITASSAGEIILVK